MMVHSLLGQLSSRIHSSNNNSSNNRSSIDVPPKGHGIPHSRSSFVYRHRNNESSRGTFPSLKMQGSSPRVVDRSLIIAPTPPSAQVVVLRELPISDPALIALRVLKREDNLARELLLRELYRKSRESSSSHSSHIVHNTRKVVYPPTTSSPPIYIFNPLGFNQPNSFAMRYMLSQIGRGELFHMHMIGNLFRQYLPSLLIGVYTWSALLASNELGITANDISDIISPLSSPGDLHHLGGSGVDGNTAAQVLQSATPASVEEQLGNEAAVAAQEDQKKSKLALYLSGILLAGAIVTFNVVVSKTRGS